MNIIPSFARWKKKKKQKQLVISTQPGVDPAPFVPKSDTLTTQTRCQVVCGSK